ncbi:MAG: hypothetical protein ACT4N8_00875 [Sphingosinicella sp.]|uniref:hypothetical protein n=1 Tax=Sphingosinicella sp. TaxID=1917971 RepID=UPI0040382708
METRLILAYGLIVLIAAAATALAWWWSTRATRLRRRERGMRERWLGRRHPPGLPGETP